MFSRNRALGAGILFVMLMGCSGAAQAFSNGITGFSGQFGSNCNVCHSGGAAPTTTITGPTLVAPGTVSTYTLTIDVPVSPTNQRAGGLDVSADGGVLSANDPGTFLNGLEITQTSPRTMNASREVIFQFDWEAPLSPGTFTIYGAGNAVNLAQGNNGDLASSTTLAITVAAATATPGESSGDGLGQLMVSGFDDLSGDISIEYESGCETTSNNLYFGPMSQVATHGYSGDDCDIGTSGSYTTFNPGGGSMFFVLVGTKGTDEGSYGTSLIGGTPAERPDFLSNVCGQSQALADRCD